VRDRVSVAPKNKQPKAIIHFLIMQKQVLLDQLRKPYNTTDARYCPAFYIQKLYHFLEQANVKGSVGKFDKQCCTVIRAHRNARYLQRKDQQVTKSKVEQCYNDLTEIGLIKPILLKLDYPPSGRAFGRWEVCLTEKGVIVAKILAGNPKSPMKPKKLKRKSESAPKTSPKKKKIEKKIELDSNLKAPKILSSNKSKETDETVEESNGSNNVPIEMLRSDEPLEPLLENPPSSELESEIGMHIDKEPSSEAGQLIERLTPLFDHVLVSKLSQTKEIGGMLLFSETAQYKNNTGKVIAVGKGKSAPDGKLIPMSVNVGDTVLLSNYGGNNVKFGDEEYVIVKEDDILGIINN